MSWYFTFSAEANPASARSPRCARSRAAALARESEQDLTQLGCQDGWKRTGFGRFRRQRVDATRLGVFADLVQ